MELPSRNTNMPGMLMQARRVCMFPACVSSGDAAEHIFTLWPALFLFCPEEPRGALALQANRSATWHRQLYNVGLHKRCHGNAEDLHNQLWWPYQS